MRKNNVRCKACGYVMDEGVYEECPACGVPSKMFELYDDKVPVARRDWLDMHIHPVIVHAPQALGFLMFFMALLLMASAQKWVFPEWHVTLVSTLLVLSIILPFTTVAGFLSGLIDGKVRYKKLNTLRLRQKMIVGGFFIVFSVTMPFLVLQPAFATDLALQLIYLVLNLGAFLCSLFLGIWGAHLTLAVMPGPFPAKKKPAAKADAKPESPAKPE